MKSEAEEKEHLNGSITSKEIKSVIRKIPTNKSPDQMALQANMTLTSKPDKGITKNENYRIISLMKTDPKILNKIPANQIKQLIKKNHSSRVRESEFIVIQFKSRLHHPPFVF